VVKLRLKSEKDAAGEDPQNITVVSWGPSLLSGAASSDQGSGLSRAVVPSHVVKNAV